METRKDRYVRELGELAGYVHGRNGRLLRLALLGLHAGVDEVTLANDIIAAGGEPRLGDAEVWRAIRKAAQQTGVKTGSCPVRRRVETPRKANLLEKRFVRDLITAGKGAKSCDLMSISPVSVKGAAAGVDFLRTIFRPEELVFVGTPYLPRTKDNLHAVEELMWRFSVEGVPLPTHILPNPLTGLAGRTSEGRESYVLDSTVAHRRMALIEFDELPLKTQVEFWIGAISKRLLPVRSLVYSGAKSIHGLIELIDDGHAEKWTEQWRTLERLLCSDDDRAYHADRLCKNPSRLTRFPGAVRSETGRVQHLLYLALR